MNKRKTHPKLTTLEQVVEDLEIAQQAFDLAVRLGDKKLAKVSSKVCYLLNVKRRSLLAKG